MPTVRPARAFGLAEPFVLPSPVEDTPDTVLKLVERVQGFGFFSGGGQQISTVAPGRAPAALADPSAALDSVTNDLAQACALGWVADQGLCAALTDSVAQAHQALLQADNPGAHAHLTALLANLDANHGPGLPINDNAYWLLKTNVEFILSHIPTGGTATAVYLTGSGGTANPPTLALSSEAPTGTSAKYQDSPAINFNGGNPWVPLGTWTAAPTLSHGTLTALGDTHVWLGLKNSDDVGTSFDLRVEVWQNGRFLASGLTRCIQGLARTATQAQDVAVPFNPVSPTTFNGTSDALSLKVLTRVGTTETGASCGGHQNATGLRLYFDASNRAAQLTMTF
jgi:hypothetical protein